jgi:hypothetical protein
MGKTLTSVYIRGWIRCQGGVCIPCRPVTPVVSPSAQDLFDYKFLQTVLNGRRDQANFCTFRICQNIMRLNGVSVYQKSTKYVRTSFALLIYQWIFNLIYINNVRRHNQLAQNYNEYSKWWHFACLGLFFLSSSELKAQVSFSDRPLSVCLSVCLSVNFYFFDFFSRTTGPILTKLDTNHPWGDSKLFKWRRLPFSKGRW